MTNFIQKIRKTLSPKSLALATMLSFASQASASNFVLDKIMYPYALHQLPQTAMHEGMHYLAAFITTEKKSLEIKILPEDGNLGFIRHSKTTKFNNAIIDIVPYIFDLAVKDRVIEYFYSNNKIKNGGLLDSYIKTSSCLNLYPLEISLFSKNCDIGDFSKNIGVNKWIIAMPLQALYGYSAYRIAKKMKNTKGSFYLGVKKSF